MTRRITLGAALLSLVLAGCGTTGTEDEITVPGDVTVPDVTIDTDTAATIDQEVTAVMQQVETEMSRVADEIAASDTAGQLEAGWQEVETEVRAAMESIRAGDAVDTAALERQFEAFQEAIDAGDIEANVREGWNQFRSEVERLMAAMG